MIPLQIIMFQSIRILACGLLLCSTAVSQNPGLPFELLFSVDYHGPLVGTQAAGGVLITEGDLMGGGLPQLGGAQLRIRRDGGLLGLNRYNTCLGHPGGTPCGIDLDALSLGEDLRLLGGGQEYFLYFSVDEYAKGSTGLFVAPSVLTEHPFGESSASVFSTIELPDLPVFPQPVGQWPGQHVLAFDGDGQVLATGGSGLAPGLGLIEPNIPGQGLPNAAQDTGSHLDALSIAPVSNLNQNSVYFSLDGGLIDPVHGYVNSGSAAFQGTDPGAVLESSGGVITVYATPGQLGLGAGDDIDALVLWENGIPGFQVGDGPYTWLDPNSPTDMLLFSLRRGSPILGQIDSLMQLPIEESDLLGPPAPGSSTPMILISGESMGLKTSRGSGGSEGDDLSGATIRKTDEDIIDCNENGIPDHVDIAKGASPDDNDNGIPDECEPVDEVTCFCSVGSSPCSNDDPNAGCKNSTGSGGRLRGIGSSSLYQDDLAFSVEQLPPQTFGILFYGLDEGTAPVVMGAGLRCASSVLLRIGPPLLTDSLGLGSVGPGLGGYVAQNMPQVGQFARGKTLHFQVYYRDLQFTCGNGSNVTNMVSIRFTQ